MAVAGLALTAGCVTAGLVAPPLAQAGKGGTFYRGFDENMYYSTDSEERRRWFDESAEANANIVRIGAPWRLINVGNQRPADASNPADPAYDFSLIDAAVREAESRGIEILMTVNGAPNWAEGADRPNSAEPGSWKPDPGAFGDFGEAVARRYSGSFVTPSGPLPEVRYFEAWNEANQDVFLAPQWERGQPFAPQHYRKMLNEFYDGVNAANPGAIVVGPGTSPFGDPPGGGRMRPLLFMRELFCLKDRRKLEPKSCADPAHLEIVSHHPINFDNPYTDSAEHPDDITVPDIGAVRRTARAATRAGTLLPKGPKALWVSELWWLTKPPSPFGVSPKLQAKYLQGSLFELWRQGVKAVLWYQIADDTAFSSGLFFSDGRPKPGLTAFRFPFVTEQAAGDRVLCWGISPGSGQLAIERKAGSGWRKVKAVSVRDGIPFQTRIRVSDRSRLRATFNGDHSLTSKPRG